MSASNQAILMVATPKGIREAKRKLVFTKDGAFVIKKVEGADFLAMAAWLPTEIQQLIPKTPQEAEDPRIQKRFQKALQEDAVKNPKIYFQVIIERGIVQEDVAVIRDGGGNVTELTLDLEQSEERVRSAAVRMDGADPTKGEINAGDLDYDDSLLKLITEIEVFSGMVAALEGRLSRFRGSDDPGSGPAGEEDGPDVLRPSE